MEWHIHTSWSESFSCSCNSRLTNVSMCPLYFKSISHPLLQWNLRTSHVYCLWRFQSIFSSNLYSNVTTSTRINSYIYVCFMTFPMHSTWFVDPIFNIVKRAMTLTLWPLLNIGYVSNETNTDVCMYTRRIYSSRSGYIAAQSWTDCIGKYTGKGSQQRIGKVRITLGWQMTV